MSEKTTKIDIAKMSDSELIKLREEHRASKTRALFKLRSQESHEQKLFKASKRLIAQINTELTARKLLSTTN